MHKSKQMARTKARRMAARHTRAAAKDRRQRVTIWGAFPPEAKLRSLGLEALFATKDGVYNPSSNCSPMAPITWYAVPKTAQVTGDDAEIVVVTLRNGGKVSIFDNGTQWSQVTIS